MDSGRKCQPSKSVFWNITTFASIGSSLSLFSTFTVALIIYFVASAYAFGFEQGDRVECTTSAGLSIRSGPGVTNSLLNYAYSPDLGVVEYGPYYASGYTWYYIDWDSPLPAGYSVTNYMEVVKPNAPTLVSPGDNSSPGSIITDLTPTMKWYRSVGATDYGLYIRDVTTGSAGPMVYSNNNVGDVASLTISPGILTGGHIYRWNMTASDSAGFSGISGTFYFQVAAPPGTFTLTSDPPYWDTTSPAGPAVKLHWTPSAGATSYDLYRNGILSASGITQTSFLNDTNLSPGQTYSYYVIATNAAGSTSSGTINVSIPNPPSPSTLAPGSVASSSAILYGKVNPGGVNTTIFFDYGTSTNYGLSTVPAAYGAGIYDSQTFQAALSGLTLNTIYHYRAGALNAGGYGYGADSNFSTIAFSLTANTPNNGQPLLAGNSYTISFSTSGNTTGIGYYDAAYSLDGGSSFLTITNFIYSNHTNCTWNVPGCISTTEARIRIRALDGYGNVLLAATNANNFVVSVPPNGTLTARADVTTTSPSPGQWVTFSAARSQPASPCIPITLYTWTFPDGTYSGPSYSTITRTFSVPAQNSASFTVSLTVEDAAGNTSTTYIPMTVSGWGQGVTSPVCFSRDPVNLANGNYVFKHTYLKIPGIGFPFEFTIFYNSQFADQTGKPLGFGWTDNYNVLLSATSTNAVVTYGDGHEEIYYLTNGQYTGAPGVFNTLVENSNDTFTVTTKDQTRENFNSQGRLTSIVDKNGNALTLSYDNGELTNITDTAGRQIAFQNDTNGRITRITDPIGRSVTFQYDASSNLVMAIDANLETNSFLYDTNHQMVAAYDGRGTCFVTNTYDALRRVVSYQADAYGDKSGFDYDFTHNESYVTNSLGKVTTYRYDNNLLVTNIVDQNGNQQFFAYDTNRDRIMVEDKDGHVTHYAFDSHGNVTNKIDALGGVTSIQYNALNNPIRRVDALGNITTFGYDSHGNLTSITNALGYVATTQYYSNGLPAVITDARGLSTTNQYDSFGDLAAVIDTDGFTNRFEYDGVGRRTCQIDALGQTNLFFYDNDNNLLYTVNALGFTNSFTYDKDNNCTSSTDPRGATTTNIFDLKNRLIAVIPPMGQETNGMVYDALDRKIASFDGLGNPTYYAYDNVGDLVAITNALDQATRYSYDPQGNQTSVIDPTGHYITNVFDPLNREVETINASISTNFTAYDALGHVIATTNAIGQITRFFYDALGRLTNVVDNADQSTYFTYDKDGNRIRMTDPDGHTWTNVYDRLNRLVEQDDPDGYKALFYYDAVGNLTNKVTPNGASIYYRYDALNQLTNIAYPDGQQVTFAYDSVGNRTNMTDSVGATTWVYNWLNQLTRVTDPYGQTIEYGYDANGNRTSISYSTAGNKTVHYGFDDLNRMTSFTNWLGGVVTYTYDSRGNVVAATNADETLTFYGYDAADRLTALTNEQPVIQDDFATYSVTLDAAGNRIQETHNQPLFPILSNQADVYTYDPDNRLLTIDGQTVTYNNNGDTTTIGTNTYVYDFNDRLLQLTQGTNSSQFTYDGLGNRLARTLNSQTERFVLDQEATLTQVLAVTDTNNAPIAYYVYGLGLAQRITPDGNVSTYHFDINGSTVALTGPNGNITDGYAYGAFGTLANSEGNSPQPFRYLGQYGIVDDGTGLLYVRARYYSPQLGRFLTEDTAPSKDNDPQTLNRYVYALNNPLRFRDVTGLVASEGNFNVFSSYPPANIIVPEQAEVLLPPTTANSTVAYIPGGSGINVVQVVNLTVIGVQVAGEAAFLGPETLLAAPEEVAVEDAGLTTLEGLSSAASSASEETAPQIFYRGDQAGLTSFQSHAAQAGGIENSEAVLANGDLTELMSNHAIDSASPPSPFISVSTDPAVARTFAGPEGTVYKIQLAPGRAILNTQNPLSESEWLVPHQIVPGEIQGTVP